MDSQTPYLRVLFVALPVQDVDQSIRFYVDQLGFNLIFDSPVGEGRFVVVGPPDGTAMISLVATTGAPAVADQTLRSPVPGVAPIVFLTENLHSLYEEWSAKGVQFQQPPHKPVWGGLFATVRDLDGNQLALVESDDLNTTLENERKSLAEKLEHERRTAQELQFAKQVQARLFPQSFPQLESLDYAGFCLQAREVGGDYYDFLCLASRKLGLVLGDISGKGMAAALLMANLQANLRSQHTSASSEPEKFLNSVNRLFFENSVESAYATLFFAEYDDELRLLRYANCGHPAAILFRADGTIDRLASTATVLGLFPDFECAFHETQLQAGDTLVIYTDGVTECLDEHGDEFGEDRLMSAVKRNFALSSCDLLDALLHDLRKFSTQEQHDDITLIIAKCTNRAA